MIFEVVEKVLLEVKSIDKLAAPSKDATIDFSILLKSLYDSSVQISRKKVGPLDQLAVAGLDDDTIWEEIQTRNKPLLRYLTKVVAQLKKRTKEMKENNDEENSIGEDDISVDEDVDADGEVASEEGSIAEEMDVASDGEIDSEDDEGDFDESRDDFVGSGSENEEEEGGEEDGDTEDDMEAWLDKEDEMEMDREAREERRAKKVSRKKGSAASDDDDVSDEDDELAFVQQHLYEGGDSDSDEGNADYKFKDFFIADKSERRKASGKPQKSTVAAKKNSKAKKASSDSEASDNEDQDGEDWDEEDDDSDSIAEDKEEDEEEEGREEEGSQVSDDDVPSQTNAVSAKTGKPSAAQQRNKALSTQISSLEEELMASKPWELRGEVKASDRPENSFLELHADIERTSKPAPVVTQAFTTSMEDMIRRRIKESNFSDVLPPKEAKAVSSDEGAAETDLSQEKSKQGLGEVYAEEFLAKSLNSQPEAVSKRLEQDRLEAQEYFHKISRELDVLSHFHFTPRPVVADSKIRTLQPSTSALSSLQLEDVTPLTSAQASTSQLAPEQVHEKKHGKQASLMAEEEMTSDDRKRARRASKAANKAKKVHEADEKMHTGAKEGPGSARDKVREENKTIDEELKRDSRVLLTTPGPAGSSSNKKAKTAPSQDTTSYSKSASFFSRLQQETSDQIKKKGVAKPGKGPVTNPFALSSNSVKL